MRLKLLKAPGLMFLAAMTMSHSVMAQTPPSCSDKRTQKLVVQEIRDRVVPGNQYRSVSLQTYLDHMKVDRPSPTGYQKDINQFNCSATLVVDNKNGADPYGKSLISNPQALYEAGSSIAEVEQFIRSDADFDRWKYSFQIMYTSMTVDGIHQVSIRPVHQVRALLIGTFIAAYADAESNK